MVYRRCARSGLIAVLLVSSLLSIHPRSTSAEWYVAGQAGMNFADPLRNVRGTGTLAGLDAPNFNLKTSPAYGGKLGFFPQHGIFGFELDVSHSTPHVKNLDDVPGIHLSVTNIGANVVLRYPGVTWQPYIGGGPAVLVAHLGRFHNHGKRHAGVVRRQCAGRNTRVRHPEGRALYGIQVYRLNISFWWRIWISRRV